MSSNSESKMQLVHRPLYKILVFNQLIVDSREKITVIK